MSSSLNSYYRIATLLCFSAVAIAISSCGKSGDALYPVKGKVMSDGKPTSGALVIFHPEGPASVNTVSSSGRVSEDGTFTLMTGDKQGAKTGKYIVTVRWPDPNKKLSATQKMMGVGPDDAPDLLKGKYETRERSPLKAEVKVGENSLEPFDVK